MIPLRTEGLGLTDTGLVREANEDRYWGSDAIGLWAVADGMGGLARGDRAATMVTAALATLPDVADFDAAVAATADAIRQANGEICALAAARGERMGSTVVALVIRDRRFGVLWCGDSRAYLFRGNQLHRLSRDHSQVQQLVDRGLIAEADAETHPMKNVLMRAIGINPGVEIDMVADAVLPGDLFLLSSDGLHGVINDRDIATLLANADPEVAGAEMIRRCHERGAPDNVTMMLVAVSEPTMLRFGALSEMPGR